MSRSIDRWMRRGINICPPWGLLFFGILTGRFMSLSKGSVRISGGVFFPKKRLIRHSLRLCHLLLKEKAVETCVHSLPPLGEGAECSEADEGNQGIEITDVPGGAVWKRV